MAPTWTFSAVYFSLLFSVTSFGVIPVQADDPAAAASTCTHNITAKAGDSCVSLASANGLTVSQFLQINPAVHSCTLDAGSAYCVSTNPAASPPASSSSSASASATAHASNTPAPSRAPYANGTTSVSVSIATASSVSPTAASSSSVAEPAQNETVLIPSPDGSDGICGGQYTCLGSVYGECCSANGYCGNSTEYCGEGCNPVYGLCGLCPADTTTTVTEFFTTTSFQLTVITFTSISTSTAFVTVVPHTTTSTLTLTTTAHTTRPAIATPTPTFPGVTRNCARFVLVRGTDSCRRIEFLYGVSQVQLTTWNPGVSIIFFSPFYTGHMVDIGTPY
ncbi:Chitin-binding, type 1 [Niveomyces insectorum RCEF 264]|uniref:Chitin-binding, type 1 n=1 Tax=Niveomyces insectorum RCEF 264 TaxID=1081102 RepID=A0A162J9K0_9HYPO|nr:Chitin-binding, type 1 [Niveomyces insectorum RCEF 264]